MHARVHLAGIDNRHGHSGSLELRRPDAAHLLQRRRLATHQRQLHAARRQPPRQRLAQATAGPGDQSRLDVHVALLIGRMGAPDKRVEILPIYWHKDNRWTPPATWPATSSSSANRAA